jgi:enoyl-CoA hydratase/carnithine racemase
MTRRHTRPLAAENEPVQTGASGIGGPTDIQPESDKREGDILVTRRAGIMHVVFNRPERHNSITRSMYRALRSLTTELRTDSQIRVVIFRGVGGRAFASGTEISEFLAIRDGEDGIEYEAELVELLHAVRELPQVTVAAVDGVCVGGGLAIATHCDVRICTAGSLFGYPIARTVGNALSASCLYRCAAIFGESLTSAMLLLSILVSAEQAHAVGAVFTIGAEGKLEDEAEAVAARVLANARETIRATKEQLLRRADRFESAPHDDEERIARVYASPDFHERVRLFLSKETPTKGK